LLAIGGVGEVVVAHGDGRVPEDLNLQEGKEGKGSEE
jgi:hypothetical protein